MDKTINRIIAYAKGCKNQEKLLDYLREFDFELQSEAFLNGYTDVDLLPIKLHPYSVMIRKVKSNKNKVDYRLWFFFKMHGKKRNHIYYMEPDNEIYKIKIPWADAEDINFRKMKITLAFPMCLDYVERRQWRTEYHKHLNNPGKYIPTEFYLRFYSHVMQLSSNLPDNKKG